LNRSLWLDEAWLSLDILKSPSIAAFLHQPLENMQTAPLGFLVIEKVLTSCLGGTEYILRLFPLFASIASLWLFERMSRIYFKDIYVPIAIFTFVSSSSLTYYASEVKPYSIDVFLILLSYVYIAPTLLEQLNLQKSMMISLLGAVMLWFSFPVFFVLSGISITVLSATIIQKDWVKLPKLGSIFLSWLFSFIICFNVFYIKIIQFQSSISYWQNGYPSFINYQSWLIVANNILAYPLGITHFSWCIKLLLPIGAFSFFLEDKKKFFFLSSPLFLIFLASGLHLYSCKHRLTLFLIPIFLMMIVNGIKTISFKTGKYRTMTAFLLTGLLFYTSFSSLCANLIHPQGKEEIKLGLSYIKKHLQPNDTIYVNNGAIPAFMYYKTIFNFSADHEIKLEGEGSTQNIIEDIRKLDRSKHVWIILSHVWSFLPDYPSILVSSLLKSNGKLLATFFDTGINIYLFDLSKLQNS